MLSLLRSLILVLLLTISGMAVRAQDNDYLKHGKMFCLCSIKLECSYCRECNDDRYSVKINNNQSKKITQVFYKFYSEPFNKILEREAKIDLREIAMNEPSIIHICVPNGNHWIISKIVYNDGSAVTFKIKDRMEKFMQEADECDCND